MVKKRDEEFRSEEPQTVERSDFGSRILKLNDQYREYHRVSRNPLDDERLTPENRINEYIEKSMSEGKSREEAIEFAIDYLEQKAERGELAGAWGEFKKGADAPKSREYDPNR